MRFKLILSYLAAFAMTFVVLATFMAMPYLSHQFVAVTGLKVSPTFTGGEPQQTIHHNGYTTIIRHPVFVGLIRPANDGFIQIDWQDTGSLPPVLTETIDFDLDGRDDFKVIYDTEQNSATIDIYQPTVQHLDSTYILKSGRAVRIALQQQP